MQKHVNSMVVTTINCEVSEDVSKAISRHATASSVLHIRCQGLIDTIELVRLDIGVPRKRDRLPPFPNIPEASVRAQFRGEKGKRKHWHSDLSWLATPPQYTVLHALEVSQQSCISFGCLEFPLQKLLKVDDEILSLKVRHMRKNAREDSFSHQLVTVDNATGMGRLMFSPLYVEKVEAASQHRSVAILEALTNLVLREDNVQTIWYSEGDTLIWDNRRVIHRGKEELRCTTTKLLLRVTYFED